MCFEEVSGENKEHDVKVFTISTCGWCKKVKKLLKELDVEFKYVDIDTLEREKTKEVRDKLKDYNPNISTPTLIIDGGEEVIIGFQKDKIKEVLEDEE